MGATGANGEMGATGCPGIAAGQSRGIVASVTASAPGNGMFFVAGERAHLTISIKDNCATSYTLAELASAALYLTGPRGEIAATSACALLNCTTDRTVASHHFIDLKSPSYANAALANLSVQADGSLRYQLGAVSTGAAGTYSALLLLDGPDPVDELAVTTELQIATATVGTNASGPANASSCASCHQSPMNGHLYMHHSHPSAYSSSPLGDFNIDSLPTETCFACHNSNGYSANVIVGKVHGLHRGADQLDPGVAHPDYNRPADATLLSYTDVVFPAMPNAERDCTTCHTDDRWKQNPSRMACGTCHDNLFFSTGTLSPPRQFGTVCTTDGDCAPLGSYVSCDPTSLSCIRATHAIQTDDTQCAGCHAADTGLAPISVAHAIVHRTQDPGLQMTQVALSGGTGAAGTFSLGDTPVLRFRLVDSTAASITDLVSNTVYSAALVVAGPTSAPEQLYPSSLNVKTGSVSYDAVADLYTYTFPSPLPASAVAPLDTTALYSRPNPPGTYTAWLYVDKAGTDDGVAFTNAGNALVQFDIGTAAPLQPRQVISDASCNTCHVKVQAHGGIRQDAEACFTCHTGGALDLGVGAKGVACTADAQCPGFAAGWEACQDTKAPVGLDTCVVTVDPTPNIAIDFRVLIHKIHFARLLGGYAEAGNLVKPGTLSILAHNNTLDDLSQALLPQDVRSCKTCHSDTKAACSTTAPCGYGQTCTNALCVNTSWLAPSATVCLACHDTEDAFGHTQLNTWAGPTGPVETCDVCHGTGAQFAVDLVHNITDPYVPPYARE